MITRAQTIRLWHGLLLLWIALLPLQTRWFLLRGTLADGPWEYGTLSLYATDVLLLLAALVGWRLHGRAFWRLPKQFPSSIRGALLGVLTLSLLSVLVAVDAGTGLIVWGHLALAALAWWCIVRSNISNTAAAIALVVSGAVEAIVALWQWVTQAVPASTLFGMAAHAPAVAGDAVVETVAGRFLRPYGTLPHPNMLAAWLLTAAIACYGLYLRSRDQWERAVLLAAGLVLQAGMFITFSRSALIAWFLVLLTVVACALLRDRRHEPWFGHFGFHQRGGLLSRRALSFALAGIVLFGLFSQTFASVVATRVHAIGRLETKSITDRLTQYRQAESLMAKHLLLGVGLGGYTKAVHDELDGNKASYDYQPVHNTLLLMLAELGIVTWLVVLWAIVGVGMVTVAQHRRRWRHARSDAVPWVVVTSLTFAGILVVSFFEHFLWSLPFGVLLVGMLFGLWGRSLAER